MVICYMFFGVGLGDISPYECTRYVRKVIGHVR